MILLFVKEPGLFVLEQLHLLANGVDHGRVAGPAQGGPELLHAVAHQPDLIVDLLVTFLKKRYNDVIVMINSWLL